MNAAGLALVFLALALLGGALWREIRQRNALRAWLLAPDLSPLPANDGAWGEIFARLRAQRHQAQQRLDELGNALERFRLAVQALPDGVMLLDQEMRIEWLNAAACQHFGLDAARDGGTMVQQLLRQREFLELLDAFRQHPGRRAALLRVGAHGGERVLSLALLPFGASGALLVSSDVSEQMRSEAMRRDFIANVSHELRTPLTVLTGFLEQFAGERPPAGEAAQTFIRLMTSQVERMNRLVADLLTLSRLESGDAPPREEIVDVPALLDALRAEAIALSAGRHAIEISDASAGKLRGSAEELRSAFGNLVFNAVRYTPEGGKITLAWRCDAGAPTFSVADTGIGIPPEHIPRLTERFYRVDKSRSTASGGTGLGLAIVKHVLARHGGRLSIASQPGKGSIFSARFPSERLATEESAA